MLLEKGDDSKFHPVYAISGRSTEPESNYHSSKLELLAIILAVSRFRSWLINIPFKIVTDCQALLYLNTQKTKNAQMIRWSNLLSEYDFDMVHRAGSKMAHMDAFRRYHKMFNQCVFNH